METRWNIYNKDGAVICTACELEYSGNWMGEVFVTANIASDSPVAFSIGDYLVYRSEVFTLDYDPAVVKKARRGTYGEGFVYQGIKFRSRQEELTRCMFLDVVPYDNGLHYTSLPDFSFYAENVTDLLERIQANLDRMYSEGGHGLWEIEVVAKDASGQKRRYSGHDMHNASGFKITDQNISVQSQSCWDALSLVSSTFEMNFYIRGRKIVVGDYDETLQDYVRGFSEDGFMRYGKGKGLYEIEAKTDDGKSVVTRIRAYGNTTNMPDRYYQKKMRRMDWELPHLAMQPNGWSSVEFTRNASYLSNMSTSTHGLGVAVQGTTAYALWKYTRAKGERQDSDNLIYMSKLSVTITNSDGTQTRRAVMRAAVAGNLLESCTAKFSFCLEDNEADWGDLCEFVTGIRYGRGIGTVSAVVITGIPATDGMWADWPEEAKTEGFPTALAVSNLMLPGFPEESLSDYVRSHPSADGNGQTYSDEQFDPFVDSGSVPSFGIRESSIKFDGSGDRADIHPSLEEVTAGDARNAGLVILQGIADTERLDEIEDAERVNDDGIVEYEGQVMKDAVVWLRDIGFDLKSYVNEATESPKLCFKTGYCGGRDFEILRVWAAKDAEEWGTKSDTWKNRVKWKVSLKRLPDTALQRYFPYSEPGSSDAFNLQGGDRFVITGIIMPEEYIAMASARLLAATKEWLADNDYTRMAYTPKIDEVLIARNRQSCVDAGDEAASVYWRIKEGMLFLFADDDLSVRGDVVIDTLRIKDGSNPVPQIEVTLREEKKANTISRLQNDIKSIRYGTSGSGGITRAQLDEAIRETGGENFLPKNGPATFTGELTADSLKAGLVTTDEVKSEDFVPSVSGYRIGKNGGESEMELDFLTVRKKFTANEVEIRRASYTGGESVFSFAGNRITRVEPVMGEIKSVVTGTGGSQSQVVTGGFAVATTVASAQRSGWKCYFLADDGTDVVRNLWQAGDFALCRTFNLTHNRYYWLEVIAVGSDYVVLADAGDAQMNEPIAGDTIVQYGNKSVEERQRAIVLDPSGPSFTQLVGITGNGNDGVVVTQFTPSGNILTGRITMQSTYKGSNGVEMQVAEGLVTDALTAKTITADNATIRHLRLERALVSGFILRDKFVITPENYNSIPRIAPNSPIFDVYHLGTTVMFSGSSWASSDARIVLPCVDIEDYVFTKNEGVMTGIDYQGLPKVLSECRQLNGNEICVYNDTQMTISVEMQTGNIVHPALLRTWTVPPRRSTSFVLNRTCEHKPDGINSYPVETYKWNVSGEEQTWFAGTPD